MKNKKIEEIEAIDLRAKQLDDFINSYGSKVEPNEELSNWMPIILICSAIVSWVIVYAVCAATGMLK